MGNFSNLNSKLQTSAQYTSLMECTDINTSIVSQAVEKVKEFYMKHSEIKPSHGWDHIQLVFNHTTRALFSLEYTLPSRVVMEIKLAALLHDMDDKKYFPYARPGEYPNASALLNALRIGIDCDDSKSHEQIVKMISWVSCSDNGNLVPEEVQNAKAYHLLIPRWADRLEAVGSRGVVRCYQYNKENKLPLSSEASPRPQNEEELWSKYVVHFKLQDYMNRGGTSSDMISHYYDKLLHIVCPPKEIVCNKYLECQARSGSEAIVEVCLKYGKTGIVDEEYILGLQNKL